MRIGFVTQPGHAVLPASGSIELWADEVATRLSDRHHVSIYASRPPSVGGPPAGDVTYRLIPHESGRRVLRVLRLAWRLLPVDRPFFASVLHPLEYWLRVGRDIQREGLDVVHVFNYSQALPILRRLTDAKLVLHMHCEWLSQLDARMIDRRLRHADLIVGCSEYITNKVRERFPQHAARCTTIYNGVETDLARTPDAASDGSIRLLNVGRVSPEKGLHVLVEALDRVVAACPAVRLTVLGEESPVPYEFAVKISKDDLVRKLARFYGGSYLQQLRERMSVAVAERVSFVDRVPHERTRRYYDEADIFVFPSIFEAFPIPPIEAMAAGLPVIASRAGGVVESVVHDRTGVLVEREDPVGLADAILRLTDDAKLQRSLGDAGRRRAHDLYAWRKIVADLEAALTELVLPTAPSSRPGEVVGLE
jgi:glycosyltransferase involved in cell wall biosynthesis